MLIVIACTCKRYINLYHCNGNDIYIYIYI